MSDKPKSKSVPNFLYDHKHLTEETPTEDKRVILIPGNPCSLPLGVVPGGWVVSDYFNGQIGISFRMLTPQASV